MASGITASNVTNRSRVVVEEFASNSNSDDDSSLSDTSRSTPDFSSECEYNATECSFDSKAEEEDDEELGKEDAFHSAKEQRSCDTLLAIENQLLRLDAVRSANQSRNSVASKALSVWQSYKFSPLLMLPKLSSSTINNNRNLDPTFMSDKDDPVLAILHAKLPERCIPDGLGASRTEYAIDYKQAVDRNTFSYIPQNRCYSAHKEQVRLSAKSKKGTKWRGRMQVFEPNNITEEERHLQPNYLVALDPIQDGVKLLDANESQPCRGRGNGASNKIGIHVISTDSCANRTSKWSSNIYRKSVGADRMSLGETTSSSGIEDGIRLHVNYERYDNLTAENGGERRRQEAPCTQSAGNRPIRVNAHDFGRIGSATGDCQFSSTKTVTPSLFNGGQTKDAQHLKMQANVAQSKSTRNPFSYNLGACIDQPKICAASAKLVTGGQRSHGQHTSLEAELLAGHFHVSSAKQPEVVVQNSNSLHNLTLQGQTLSYESADSVQILGTRDKSGQPQRHSGKKIYVVSKAENISGVKLEHPNSCNVVVKGTQLHSIVSNNRIL